MFSSFVYRIFPLEKGGPLFGRQNPHGGCHLGKIFYLGECFIWGGGLVSARYLQLLFRGYQIIQYRRYSASLALLRPPFTRCLRPRLYK